MWHFTASSARYWAEWLLVVFCGLKGLRPDERSKMVAGANRAARHPALSGWNAGADPAWSLGSWRSCEY